MISRTYTRASNGGATESVTFHVLGDDPAHLTLIKIDNGATHPTCVYPTTAGAAGDYLDSRHRLLTGIGYVRRDTRLYTRQQPGDPTTIQIVELTTRERAPHDCSVTEKRLTDSATTFEQSAFHGTTSDMDGFLAYTDERLLLEGYVRLT
ncbi:hypothetical protein ACWEN6_14030 [Sphaerisporangium sp. NPDC004334]